jgi:hypothetical protein
MRHLLEHFEGEIGAVRLMAWMLFPSSKAKLTAPAVSRLETLAPAPCGQSLFAVSEKR